MIRSRRPGSPGEVRRLQRWKYEPIPCNTNRRGWLAGEPFGAWVHYLNKKSLPCREKMSEGKLACEHCAKGLIPDWRGYTPWYDEEYTRRFSLITSPYYESVLEIGHLAHIVIRRGKQTTDAVVFRQEAWRSTPIPHAAERAEPVDLGPFLIHVLWQDAGLIALDKNDTASLPGMEADLIKNRMLNGDRGSLDDLVKLALGPKADQVDRVARNNEFAKNAHESAQQNGQHTKKPR